MSLKEWLIFHYNTSLHELNLLIRNCGLIKIILQTFFDEYMTYSVFWVTVHAGTVIKEIPAY